jgi:hypothetical protein
MREGQKKSKGEKQRQNLGEEKKDETRKIRGGEERGKKKSRGGKQRRQTLGAENKKGMRKG